MDTNALYYLLNNRILGGSSIVFDLFNVLEHLFVLGVNTVECLVVVVDGTKCGADINH